MPDVLEELDIDRETPHPTPEKFQVHIAYNGIEKEFEVNRNQPVHVLLNHSIAAFGVSNQPHILSLFNAAGVELPDAAKLGEVGVSPGDHLLLRPGAVKGGSV
jgi:hypothetical protein